MIPSTKTLGLALQGIFAAALFASPLLAESGEKNVLIFFIDDLRPELHCYGADYIKSPAIDSLASQGVLFESAYCQQALCAPSRISMMTGQYPDTNGIADLFTPLLKVDPKAVTLPGYFKKRGYVTSSFGKVYHHNRDDKPSWSQLGPKSAIKYASPETLKGIEERVAEGRRKGADVDELRTLGKGPAVEIAEVEDEAYADGQVAKEAIESLRRNKDKPFFMCVGFAKPHLPFATPKRYWDLYKREQFTVPERKLPEGAPSLAFTVWGELRGYLGIPEEGDLTDEQTRELQHGYAASVSFADAQVGKVMAELDRLGLRENTIVVLWGDHGYKLGDYGLWCKHTNLELDTRVPLIISAPGHAKGERSKALVEIIDIFPTVAEMSGGDIPSGREGKSLEPLLQDPGKDFRPFALSQYPRGSTMGYSLRTDRWRYTEWIKSDTKQVVFKELYDHRESETPQKNLADEAEHAELVSKLSQQMNAAQRVGSSKVYEKN
ncbi:sulfatase [Haloferula chungangensis]|uniref:Sulfatase n=1 Tax=Haloferula chungangensis TaxID=1048331 RepID=A0ABW2L0W6_9BACT